jgi:hypothetical protein
MPGYRAQLLLLALTAAALAPANAQNRRRAADDRRDPCRDRDRDESYCEVREYTLGPRQRLAVNGHANGGISVDAWDRNEIQVRVIIHTRARSESDARDLAHEIEVDTSGTLRADGPSGRWRSSWSASFEITVPRRTDLDLDAMNGGISVAGVEGRLDLRTQNGGIDLDGVAGDVRGRTQNGGIDVRLTGSKWNGQGLDLQTSNGGVEMRVPDGYSARLETGTVNGGMDIDFPITVSGRLTRRIEAVIGSGGPTVRAVTTNGSVSLRRG